MQKPSIFLAEDDVDDRFLVNEIFQELFGNNYKLAIFENGSDLLGHIESLSERDFPALIILDQNMPKMNGKETLKHLKSTSLLKNLPVVIYSTYYDKEFNDECLKIGAKSIVSKPDSYKKFREMITTFMKEI